AGASLGVADAPSARHVVGFTEKPDAATAAQYLATGEYRWNAGMFLSQAGVLLDHLADQIPPLAAGVRRIAAAWDTPARDDELAASWPGLTKIAIDHAIAEPVAAAGGVAVVPGGFGWDDIGDFASLATLLASSGTRTLGHDEEVLRIGADDALVVTSGRTVSVVGLAGAVVVDTPDAVLVTTRAHAQSVKAAVDSWRAAGREDLL
ncbi:MAG: mannose-1-phosphate guanylyltransferase, partial [Cellulomonas sp.]|nr:mannose-1-phosphate guanylyltransferase [Cellulomonas sp.]